MTITTYFRRLKKHATIHEISGSLGDLGTLLPIMMSLAIGGQINLTSTLWFTGIWNILSGVFFQVPVCVQPMKAIAAVVLSSKLTIQENMGAGLGVAALIFFLGATRLIHVVGKFTPPSIVKGLQLGAAIQLINKAHSLVVNLKWTIDASNWNDNNTWILLSFMFVVACYNTRIPSALIIFIIGLIFALVYMYATPAGATLPRPSVIGGHYPNTIIVPNEQEFRTGLLNAGLGQLPLTALNSVIALCALISDLFPEKSADASNVAMSVGIMNLVGCWFGAMPLCHGSGGLAGQYRFGARSELSVIFLGSCKLLLGVLFGSSLVGLLEAFPTSILAVMLFISGIELASAARNVNDNVVDDTRKRENFVVLLLTAGSLVAYSNDGIGFLTGIVSAVLLSMQRRGLSNWLKVVFENARSIPKVWMNKQDLVPPLPVTQDPHDQNEETILAPSQVKDRVPSYQSQAKPHLAQTETSNSIDKASIV